MNDTLVFDDNTTDIIDEIHLQPVAFWLYLVFG